MRTSCRPFLLFAVLLAPGCEANRYEIEMTIDGQFVERRLVCWRQGGSEEGAERDDNLREMPAGELEQIARAYRVDVPERTARKYEFIGRFTDSLPADVGGSGAVVSIESDMGTAGMYVERFRGRDDLWGTLDARRQAADELGDAVAYWVQGEVGDDPEFARVRGFLSGALRQDLRTASAYANLAVTLEGVTRDPSGNIEFLVRFGHYLAERGYLTPADLPELMDLAEGSDNARLLAFVRRGLATRLGLEELSAKWDFLKDASRLEASLDRQLADYPPFREFLADWQQAHPNEEAAEPPRPSGYVTEVLLRMLGLRLGARDTLIVRLRCPTRPYRTNGAWLDASGQVVWEHALDPRNEPPLALLPTLLFANWSVPSETYQMSRFGRVILDGELLAAYCGWYRSLTAAEAVEWRAALEQVAADASAEARLEQFRFTGEAVAEGEERPPSRADRGREIVLAALRGE
jgi:hypothetical protein